MTSSSAYADYIENDLLAYIPGITSKRMFGGYGFYLDGYIFAIIVDDELYFKTDESIEPEFESRGSNPFIYDGHKKKGPVKMPYWKVPIDIQEDQGALEQWVRRSAQISREK